MAVELIKSMSYARILDIISFEERPKGKVQVNAAKWIVIPMNPASGEFTFTSRMDAAGVSYTSTLSARLKENIGVIPECILKITLCSGEELILGTPFIPLRSDETKSLSLTRLSINHSSVTPPAGLID